MDHNPAGIDGTVGNQASRRTARTVRKTERSRDGIAYSSENINDLLILSFCYVLNTSCRM